MSMSDEDLEAEENEFGSLDDDSPPGDNGFMSSSMLNMGGVTSMPASSAAMYHSGMNAMMPPSQMIQPQLLQQHM